MIILPGMLNLPHKRCRFPRRKKDQDKKCRKWHIQNSYPTKTMYWPRKKSCKRYASLIIIPRQKKTFQQYHPSCALTCSLFPSGIPQGTHISKNQGISKFGGCVLLLSQQLFFSRKLCTSCFPLSCLLKKPKKNNHDDEKGQTLKLIHKRL